MKKIIIYTILVVLFSINSLFAKSQNEPEVVYADNLVEQDTVDNSVITITDSFGRKVTINGPVKRIAYSHFATAEALKILDAWDLVKGRGAYTSDEIIYNNLDNIPVIVTSQSVYSLNYESIYELNIDLFLAVNIPIGGFDEMVSKLEPNIPVVALNFHEPETLAENIEKLGKLLGKEKEATEFRVWFNSLLTEMKNKTTSLVNEDKPRMFYKTGWGKVDDIQTFTSALPGISTRDTITGCINIAEDLASTGGWVQAVDPEWLVVQDIDVLIINDALPGAFGTDIDDDSFVKKHRDEIMASPVFLESSAVENHRVYMFPGEFFGAPRFIIGYVYMAKWFHPDLFKNLNPRAIHQEYLTRFMRIDYDLNKHGVFVYPEDTDE